MIDLAKHDGEIEVRMDLPARGRMVSCVVHLGRDGLSVRRVGRRRALRGPWWKIFRALDVPDGAPAKFCGDREGMLADGR